jgi:hypothetical protein
MGGAIRNRHGREGVEWRRGQARCEEEVRDGFLTDLDNALHGLRSPAGEFGRVLRHFYNWTW